jgi:hypothetical protein
MLLMKAINKVIHASYSVLLVCSFANVQIVKSLSCVSGGPQRGSALTDVSVLL